MELSYLVVDNKYYNIKQVLKEEFHMSDRLILKLKKSQNIFLNNEHTYINKTININDTILIRIDFIEDNSNIVACKMDLNILYEDEYMLILNKPAGIAVHPSCSHYDNSLSNGVKYYFDTLGLSKKIRIVNRLDKDTSGIVIFAKNEYIQECLVKQMANGIFKKNYICVVCGKLENKKGIIDKPISRKENSIIERCVDSNGDNAITKYYVIKEFCNMSLVYIRLKTGRTHQIRVHMSYLNCPIVGDTLYGTSSPIINRQALHSYRVRFIHPVTNKYINIKAIIPDDIKHLLI